MSTSDPSSREIDHADTIHNALSQARSIAHLLSISDEGSTDAQHAAWAIRDLIDAAHDAHRQLWAARRRARPSTAAAPAADNPQHHA